MSDSASSPDGSAPLSRRDLLRLGAASLGVPFVAPSTTPLALADRPAQGNAEATPLSDFPTWEDFPIWEGEDYPDHPDPRARSVNNLKFMGLAMHNFTAMNGGRLPAAAISKGGQALLSWRVAILPFLEQFALYERFHLDEAWDSPHNMALLKEMPRAYAPVTHKDAPPYSTYYQGFVGPGSLFDGEEGTRIMDVIDAIRPTLMIVEAAHPVPWTKPEDVPYDEAKPLPKLGGQFEDGFYVGCADGSARFVSRKIAPERLRALIIVGSKR
jgi:Protein of unknown function (DUF1559)